MSSVTLSSLRGQRDLKASSLTIFFQPRSLTGEIKLEKVASFVIITRVVTCLICKRLKDLTCAELDRGRPKPSQSGKRTNKKMVWWNHFLIAPDQM